MKIWFEGSVSTQNELRAEIDVPHLRALSIAGSSDMSVVGLAAESFTVRIRGSASGSFAGVVGDLDVDIAGSSNLDFFEVEADQVSVDIAGSGRLQATARRKLDVDLSGSGVVTYRGQPQLSIDVAGSGKIVQDS